MLPAGLVAQPADRADHRTAPHAPSLRADHRPAWWSGACSCDLVRARDPDPREDERHHRDRFRRAGTRATR